MEYRITKIKVKNNIFWKPVSVGLDEIVELTLAIRPPSSRTAPSTVAAGTPENCDKKNERVI